MNERKKLENLLHQNLMVDLLLSVILGITFFYLIDSLVMNVVLPGLGILFGSDLEGMKVTVRGYSMVDGDMVIPYGIFISKFIILLLTIIFLWLFYLAYRKRKVKTEKMNEDSQELSSGDILHVEMRDLLKNLVEIRDILENKNRKNPSQH